MIGGVTRFKRLVLSPLNSTMFPPDSIVSFYSFLFTMEENLNFSNLKVVTDHQFGVWILWKQKLSSFSPLKIKSRDCKRRKGCKYLSKTYQGKLSPSRSKVTTPSTMSSS